MAILPARRQDEHRPMIFLDNASAHKNKEVKTLMEKHFQLMYIPQYSCRFNNIERVWSFVRRNYNNRITYVALRRDYNQDDVYNCIELACENVTSEQIISCRSQNRKFLNEILPDELKLPK